MLKKERLFRVEGPTEREQPKRLSDEKGGALFYAQEKMTIKTAQKKDPF
ncbi:hypothetical protein JOC77_001449 [Peribacillus deserti]|uniref:Uncharacterized protein n=1 Tax=Peribacillus deserti TaxID=673318 RepID=A0ABS2QFZ7_9BACI|nr:hypothetical protein [Peribacillus deserti]MBM7692022.1 hypothetical protein [Peribacillus deserti]